MDDNKNQHFVNHGRLLGASAAVHPMPSYFGNGVTAYSQGYAPIYAHPPGTVPYDGDHPLSYVATAIPINAFQGYATQGIPMATAYPVGSDPSAAFAYPTGQTPPGYTVAINYAFANAAYANPAFAGMAAAMGMQHIPYPNSDDPVNQIPRDAWSTGLFSCLDHCVPNCLMSFLCPCVSIAHIHARLGNPRSSMLICQLSLVWITAAFMRLMPELVMGSFSDGYSDSPMPLLINLPLLFPFFTTAAFVGRTRSLIRFRFRLPGSGCEDCLVACCCGPCSIAQMATHTKSYTPGACSFNSPSLLPSYP